MPLFFASCGALGFGVFLETEAVGGLEGAGEDVLVGFGEDDVRGAVFAPATVDGQENFGKILDEELLLLGIEHEVAVAFFDVGKRGEDVAADAEVGGAEVGALLGVRETQSDAAEVSGIHGEKSIRQ